ncbi:MAG: hypothetical protein FWF87_01705 [Synergistaceae bacterium]|nr:hypothetical protein [Synergistaceae bacterium]
MGDNYSTLGADSPITIAKNHSTATTTISHGITPDELQKLKELISEVKKHIGELPENKRNEFDGILGAVEEEAKRETINEWSLKGLGKYLSDIAKAIPAGLLCNAVTELVRWKFFS